MVIIRYTWQIEGRFEEVRRLFLEIKTLESKMLRAYRSYQATTGLINTLALECEFESLAEWEEFSRQFFTMPENADKFRKWEEIVTGSATCEVWNLLTSG